MLSLPNYVNDRYTNETIGSTDQHARQTNKLDGRSMIGWGTAMKIFCHVVAYTFLCWSLGPLEFITTSMGDRRIRVDRDTRSL